MPATPYEPGFSDPSELSGPASAPAADALDDPLPPLGSGAPATPPAVDPDAAPASGEEPVLDRSGITSPSGRSSQRPRLDERAAPAPAAADDDLPPEAAGNGPVLEPPQRTSARVRRLPLPASRRAALRRDLQAMADDPGDLFAPPRADRPWRYIVLHHSAHEEGGLAQIDRDHRERLGTAGCGYHFVVGNGTGSGDGRIEVARRWSEQRGGQHCRDSRIGDINEYGIGICLVGDLESGTPSAQQVEAARALVAYLQDRYAIPDANVVTHDTVATNGAACPGRNFPRQALLGREDRALSARPAAYRRTASW